MKNAKRVIIPVVIVLVVLLALNSCKDTLGAVIDQATGKADTVQEEDTTQWAELTSDPLSLEGIGDPSAKYAAAAVNSCLNIVFNGIWSRQTDYFTVPGGSLTITGNLDSATTAEIMEMICGFARKFRQTIILVTHDPEMAAYADRVVKLIDGEIVSDERTPHSQTSPNPQTAR